MLSTDEPHGHYRVISDAPDYLLVDKPAGSSVHREGVGSSLLERIRADHKLDYLAPVHRLDKLTSGLWLLAKNPAAAAELSQQFAQRSVEKYYLALSDRKPRKKQGSVDGALLKARGGSYRLARQGEPWSQTQFFSYGLGQGLRLFLLKPLTGRTHQLRVVMKSLGAPIIGDSRYYGHGADSAHAVLPDRCYLHAYALGFTFAGERHRIIHAPQDGILFTAESCRARLTELAEPWTLAWPGRKPNDEPVN